MESKQKRTALVTGGSSGIGRCTAVALSKAGYIVYEFSRRDVPVESVRHMCVDVTDEASVQEAVGQILSERGSIEILVNCASIYAQTAQWTYCQYQFCGSSGTHSVSGILFCQ